MKHTEGIQLEMNFDGPKGNRFKDKMNNGIFQVLLEIDPPPENVPLEDAVARFAEVEYLVSARTDLPVLLTFTDHSGAPENKMDTVSFASALCKMDRDKHLLCVSGRTRPLREVEKLLGHAVAEGFRNVLALSGGSISGDTPGAASKRCYTESVHILRSIREHFADTLNAGCAVNPYCYVPETSFPQYFKLMKKIASGASFMVTQFGWDMCKLQELRWFLSTRSMHLPSIARFLVLTPDRADDICAGKVPGVHISPDLETMLRREMTGSLAMFEAAQWRRIQIHAAGARFLGYSGIQIAGVDRPEQVNLLLTRLSEALREFSSFEEWLTAYRDYYDRLELAPYPYLFYQFEDLLSSAQPPEQPVRTQSDFAPVSGLERFRYRLASSLFAHADTLPPGEKHLTKKLLVSCRGCVHCRLPQLHFICPETCPKGMANGPCGAVGLDGTCEFGSSECIHSRRMRLAEELNDFAALEECLIDPVRGE
ncbi:MAG: methylenetetrahydrofolate reductase C-terminal domain-containing protein [Lentisphaeria bacterium]|nr:methylenetetrahydrofolate reductase C-terminal domain-containing protein [Lentisphaeria bacterium]